MIILPPSLYAITYLDKADASLCFVCFKYYLQIIIDAHFPNGDMDDTVTPHTYRQVAETPNDVVTRLLTCLKTLDIDFKPKHPPPRAQKTALYSCTYRTRRKATQSQCAQGVWDFPCNLESD